MVKVDKPWGYELIWAKNKSYVAKILFIRKGHRLSYQYHREKVETIYLARGLMEFEYEEVDGDGRKKVRLQSGDSFHIPAGMKHRMSALEDCEVFEVSTAQSGDTEDIVRLEDDYSRNLF